MEGGKNEKDQSSLDLPEEPLLPMMDTVTPENIKEPLSVDTSETDTVSLDSERHRYILGSNSSAGSSPKGSSGNTSPTGKSTPPISPQPSRESLESDQSRDGQRSHDDHQRGSSGRPNRLGISWRVNSRLEAMDFQKKWYPARIVDIDDTDNTILIHFDGWNQRYDEWMNMRSDRIRPLQRHSGRKGKATKNNAPSKLEHKIGDNVFAKWTDCRMYAGTIVGVNKNGSYEVLFYDGFKKSVQPINVKAMSMEVQREYAVAGILPDPTKRPKQKMQMLAKIEEKSVDAEDMTGEGPPQMTGPGAVVKGDTDDRGRRGVRKKSLEISGLAKDPSPPALLKKSRVKGHTGRPVFRNREEKMLERPDAAEETAARKDNEPRKRTNSKSLTPESGRRHKKSSSRKSASKMFHPMYDSSDEEASLTPVTPRDKSSGARPSTSGGEQRLSTSLAPIPGQDEFLGPKKAFRVEEEHNKFKCPYENCNKSFRKMSLVDYHIKYYHTQDGKPVVPPSPSSRKRKKTISACSSDSEMSASGRGLAPALSSKKKRERMTSTSTQDPIPDSLPLSALEDVMLHDLSEDTHTTTTEDAEQREAAVTEDHPENPTEVIIDELNKDEVVNCICQINEENGLMIQCDVCLCWQHAVCMELSEETLPSKYVCYVCLNPPGVRDSARFSYDQDWLKQGTMARFACAPPDPFATQKAQIMKATHSLVGDVLNVQNVLRSTKCQLHALKKKNHPEVKLWVKNWVRLMAEEKMKEEQERLKLLERAAIPEELKTEIKEEPISEADPSVKTEPPTQDQPVEDPPKDSILDTAQQSMEGLKPNESSNSLSSMRTAGSEEDTVVISSEDEKREDRNIESSTASMSEDTMSSDAILPPALDNPDKISADISSAPAMSQSKPSETPSISLSGISSSTSHAVPGTSSSKESTSGASSSAKTFNESPSPGPSTSVSKPSSLPASDPSLPGTSGSKPQEPQPSTSSQFSSTSFQDFFAASIAASTPRVEAVVEEPFRTCDQNLLEHISVMQDNVESRLDLIEEQINALESADDSSSHSGSSDVLSDLPRVKKAINQVMFDLVKVKRLSLYH